MIWRRDLIKKNYSNSQEDLPVDSVRPKIYERKEFDQTRIKEFLNFHHGNWAG